MDNDAKEPKTTESTDSYVISTCIALLSSYFIMFSISKPANIFMRYSITISILFLFITLFAFIWHKIRWRYRNEYFKKERNKIIESSAKEIRSGLFDFFMPRFDAKLSKMIIEESLNTGKHPKEIDPRDFVKDDKDREKMFQAIAKESDKPLTDQIYSYSKNLVYEMQHLYEESFKKPLNERFGRLKFYLDVFSHTARYFFFTLGIIFCFISMMLHLYQ